MSTHPNDIRDEVPLVETHNRIVHKRVPPWTPVLVRYSWDPVVLLRSTVWVSDLDIRLALRARDRVTA